MSGTTPTVRECLTANWLREEVAKAVKQTGASRNMRPNGHEPPRPIGAAIMPLTEAQTYDPACEELARHFLADEGHMNASVFAPALAQEIQNTVESFLAREGECVGPRHRDCDSVCRVSQLNSK